MGEVIDIGRIKVKQKFNVKCDHNNLIYFISEHSLHYMYFPIYLLGHSHKCAQWIFFVFPHTMHTALGGLILMGLTLHRKVRQNMMGFEGTLRGHSHHIKSWRASQNTLLPPYITFFRPSTCNIHTILYAFYVQRCEHC